MFGVAACRCVGCHAWAPPYTVGIRSSRPASLIYLAFSHFLTRCVNITTRLLAARGLTLISGPYPIEDAPFSMTVKGLTVKGSRNRRERVGGGRGGDAPPPTTPLSVLERKRNLFDLDQSPTREASRPEFPPGWHPYTCHQHRRHLPCAQQQHLGGTDLAKGAPRCYNNSGCATAELLEGDGCHQAGPATHAAAAGALAPSVVDAAALAAVRAHNFFPSLHRQPSLLVLAGHAAPLHHHVERTTWKVQRAADDRQLVHHVHRPVGLMA